MVKVDAPCPECSQTPVHRFDLMDGNVWVCPACGHQEITAGVDVEAQLNALAEYDPELAAGWREALGL